jgi:hypothetical protein
MALTKITLTNIDKAGDYSELVDSTFNVANSASSYANSGFTKANTSSTDAASASSYANSAFSKANTNSTVAQSGSDKTGSYTLATSDVGKFVGVGSGGSIVIPENVMLAISIMFS